jgi:hypothetical protein
MAEAFQEYVDLLEGGLTKAGYDKFGRSSHWLLSSAEARRNSIQFEKIKDDSEKVNAWPVKGRVANLG